MKKQIYFMLIFSLIVTLSNSKLWSQQTSLPVTKGDFDSKPSNQILITADQIIGKWQALAFVDPSKTYKLKKDESLIVHIKNNGQFIAKMSRKDRKKTLLATWTLKKNTLIILEKNRRPEKNKIKFFDNKQRMHLYQSKKKYIILVRMKKK